MKEISKDGTVTSEIPPESVGDHINSLSTMSVTRSKLEKQAALDTRGPKKLHPRFRPEKRMHLDNLKYVSVCHYGGKKMIHIRQFYEGHNGKILPTKRGITLSVLEWQSLLQKVTDVNTEINV